MLAVCLIAVCALVIAVLGSVAIEPTELSRDDRSTRNW